MQENCTDCGANLTDADLREGPENPTVGYVYYKCPECGNLMPGPPDASPDDDTPSYLPNDPDWRENPRDYHDKINLTEAVYHIIEDERESENEDDDGVHRDTVIDAAADHYNLTPDETENLIEDLLAGGRCYEPDDDHLQTI